MQHNDLCVILTYFHYVGKNLKFGASCSERERERAIGNVLPVYLPAWVSCSHAGCTQGLPIASWITTWASVSVCSGEPWCHLTKLL